MQETPTATTESEVNKPQPIKRENYTLAVTELGGKDVEGFYYYYPQFNTVAAALSHYGEELLLGKIINSKIAFTLQTKARNKLIETEEEKEARTKSNGSENPYLERLNERMENGDVIVVTPQEAEEWQPSEREATSIGGVTKKMIQALKDAKEAKQKGDLDRFAKCQAEAKEYRAILSAMQDEEINKLEAA